MGGSGYLSVVVSICIVNNRLPELLGFVGVLFSGAKKFLEFVSSNYSVLVSVEGVEGLAEVDFLFELVLEVRQRGHELWVRGKVPL